jgi:AraC family transcriptional regulator
MEDGVAECLGGLEEPAAHDPPGEVPVWLHRVHERIRDERGRRIRVADLARDAGVHPVYLTRRFRRAFGCSVVGYIQAERVRMAADGLAATDEPLSGLAYGAGFADQAHLTRVFARASGLTPAAYRDLAQGGAKVAKVQEHPVAPA